MSRRTPLAFDPIERGSAEWGRRYPEVERMRAITSIMRVQQLLQGQLDDLLKPFGLTFARYEVLVLLSFSRRGALSLGRIGERLQVHATSVTPLVNRLADAGFIERRPDPDDGRAVLALLTTEGRRVLGRATDALAAAEFGLGALSPDDCESLTAALTPVRREAGDFR